MEIATAAEATSRHLSHLPAALATQGTANAVRKEASAYATSLYARESRTGGEASRGPGQSTHGYWQRKEERRTCYRCGGAGHIATAAECTARESIWGICGKNGHFSRVCCSRIQSQRTRTSRPANRPSRRDGLHHIKEEEDNGIEEDLMFGECGLQWISAQENCTMVNSCGDKTSARERDSHSVNLKNGHDMLME